MRETGLATTPFNSSLAFLERIEDTWKLVTAAKIQGDVTTYFRTLEDIFRSTHPIFSDEEIALCEAQIKTCEGHISNASNSQDLDLWVGENKCDELKMIIVKLLFKYKITYFKADKLSWEDELKEDFS